MWQFGAAAARQREGIVPARSACDPHHAYPRTPHLPAHDALDEDFTDR
jgi:hypothetical protein